MVRIKCSDFIVWKDRAYSGLSIISCRKFAILPPCATRLPGRSLLPSQPLWRRLPHSPAKLQYRNPRSFRFSGHIYPKNYHSHKSTTHGTCRHTHPLWALRWPAPGRYGRCHNSGFYISLLNDMLPAFWGAICPCFGRFGFASAYWHRLSHNPLRFSY